MQTNVRTLTLAAFGALAGTVALAAAPRAADAQWYQSPAFAARPLHFGIPGGLRPPIQARLERRWARRRATRLQVAGLDSGRFQLRAVRRKQLVPQHLW